MNTNREIKFRAQKTNSTEWVEGLLHFSYGTGEYFITQSDGWQPSYHNPDAGEETLFIPINSETICQYIGLKDKNDKNIWENDIIKIARTINEIKVFVVT